MDAEFKRTAWYQFLDHGMQDLVSQAYSLWIEEQSYKKNRYHDYSFIVFPMAKAYEGFLKKYFQSLQLIDEEVLFSRHFRIGRSLNPDLPEKYRDETWFFDDLEKFSRQCGAHNLAQQLWQAWVEGRNKTFHYYFPDHSQFIKLSDADRLLNSMTNAMSHAVECLKS